MQVGGPFVRWPGSGSPPLALGCVAARTRDMGPRELGLSGPFHGWFSHSGCEWGIGTVAPRSDFGQRLHMKHFNRTWDQYMGTVPESSQFKLKQISNAYMIVQLLQY